EQLTLRPRDLVLLTEVDLWRLLRALICLEIRLFFKAHQARHQDSRKTAARSVVFLRGQSVVTARSSQPVLSSRKFILKPHKAFVGFQLRIIFSNCKEATTGPQQTTVTH